MKNGLIFSKFGSEQFVVDEETFVMGVHHQLGEQIAKRFIGFSTVLDACSGAGFMAIALSKYACQVITTNINTQHLKMAKENAAISGLQNKVTFLEGDILEFLEKKQIKSIDAAFLDPDWTPLGEVNKRHHTSKLSQMQPDGGRLLSTVLKFTPNICFRLPQEFCFSDLSPYPPHEVENITQDGKLKFYCAWFGNLRIKQGTGFKQIQ